ncbi:MAG: hypothetical protein M3024_05655 [Candidatus Dormibacteraeota bacterium]|nr:hypothetical protein [Candidatus Dormibacteraeota bacterium]
MTLIIATAPLVALGDAGDVRYQAVRIVRPLAGVAFVLLPADTEPN